MSASQPTTTRDASNANRFRGGMAAASAPRLLVVLAGVVGVLGVLSQVALAVQPSQWVHTAEADFQPGEAKDVVVTNLGDLKLATSTESLADLPEEVTVINDLQQVGDAVYVAGGPKGHLLEYRDGEVTEVVALESGQIFSLAVGNDGKLLVGVSAETSYIATPGDDGELTTIVELPEVRYVWDIIVDGDSLILATGTEGKVLRVTPGDEPQIDELLDAAQSNILCLGIDEVGRIYAGTDKDGLIYRLTPKADGSVTAFVLYDADEPEIGAMIVRPDGTVYAGTADAEQARPGRLEEAAQEEAGRPEGGAPPAEGAPQEGDDGDDGEGDGDDAPPEPGDIPGVEPTPEPIGGEGDDAGDNAAEPADADGDKVGNGISNSDSVIEVTPDGNMALNFTGSLPARSGNSTRSTGIDPLRARVAAAMQDGDKPAPGKPDAPAGEDRPEAGSPAVPPAAQPTGPTADQRNQLRDVIRQRLLAARKTGELQVQPGQRPSRRPGASVARPQPGQQRPGGQPPKQGNAIYRIDPDGFVSEVFRESVMILDMLDQGDRLLVATGSEGQLFSVSPTAEETSIIADLEPEQIPAMMLMPGDGDDPGAIVLGTANPSGLVEVGRGYAQEGTFTSQPLDATQISLWGKMHIVTRIAENGSLKVETRSGNVADPEHAPWSEWVETSQISYEQDADPLDPRQISVESPPARFLQYRLTLMGDGESTSAVDRVQMTYVTPNLKPSITAVQAQYTGQQGQQGGGRSGRGNETPEPTSPTGVNLSWEVSDPNGDPLTFGLEYQASTSEDWVTLEDDLAQNQFEWKIRLVPDGRYRVRVSASDAPANPGGMAETARRISEPILVDNTPPTIEEMKRRFVNGDLLVTFVAKDELARVLAVHYTLDSEGKYEPVLPDDLIYDSTSEAITIKLAGLSPDPHTLTIRVVDGLGNARYEALHLAARRADEQAK